MVGVITFAAGVIGVMGGAEISRRIRHIYDNAEALVCAFGVLAGSPLLFVALYLSTKYILGTWVSLNSILLVSILFESYDIRSYWLELEISDVLFVETALIFCQQSFRVPNSVITLRKTITIFTFS